MMRSGLILNKQRHRQSVLLK